MDEPDLGGAGVDHNLRAGEIAASTVLPLVGSDGALEGRLAEVRMIRGEAVALVRRIMAAEYASDAEAAEWIDSLIRALGCPHIVNLIFYPENGDPPTGEDVVDRALAYQPIAL